MKHTYAIILLSIFTTEIASAQGSSNWSDIDTLRVYSDKIFVDYKTYSDSTLTEEGQAFLYPDTIEVRKSRWLPRFIKSTLPVDRIVIHGTVTTHRENGKYRIGEYEQGEKLKMTYYDSTGTEISRQDFYGTHVSHRDPEQGTDRYFIHGSRKKKR